MALLKIGTEIEWSCKIRAYDFDSYWQLQVDRSVEGRYNSHEFATKIDSLVSIDTTNPRPGINQAVEQFKKLVGCMSAIDVNHTQGIHFHVSGFKKLSAVFSKEFHDEFISDYQKMCKTDLERNRVDTSITKSNGRTNYCRAVYDTGDRYRAVNYVHAYAEWKTIEFRLFASTKSVADYRRYLTTLIRTIIKYENKKLKEDVYTAKDDDRSPSDIKMNEVLL